MIPSGFSPRAGRRSSDKEAEAESICLLRLNPTPPFLENAEEGEERSGILGVKAVVEEKREPEGGLRGK